LLKHRTSIPGRLKSPNIPRSGGTRNTPTTWPNIAGLANSRTGELSSGLFEQPNRPSLRKRSWK